MGGQPGPEQPLSECNMSPEKGCARAGARTPAPGRGPLDVAIRIVGSSVPGSEMEEDLADVREGGPVDGEVPVAGL